MDKDPKLQFLASLNKVQGIIEPVKKDSENPHFRSRYASLAAVNEAIMLPLSENGFIVMQGGSDIGGKAYLKTDLLHIGGHCESFYYPLVIDENPQHIASSVTYARRYSLCALLNLSTDDDDAEVVAQAKRAPESAPKKVLNAEIGEVFKTSFTPSGYSVKHSDPNKEGRPWTKYSIKNPEGDFFSTFDEKLADLLENASKDSEQICVTFKKDKTGKYNTIVEASLAESVPF